MKKKDKEISKGGRPEKGEKARNISASVMISKEDQKLLQKLMVKTNKTRSEILYSFFKKGKIDVVEKFGFSKEDLRLLAIANNNLNQIARMVNSEKNGVLYPESIQALELVAENLAMIRPE